jgi:hypothetical protein
MARDGAVPMTVTGSQRWLARLAYMAVFAAVLLLVIGGRSSLAVVVVGVLGILLTLAAVWWFLSHRGPVRWVSAVLVVASPIVVIVRLHLPELVVGGRAGRSVGRDVCCRCKGGTDPS